ncbi:hypothetical protein MNBD_GAMMA12-528 [hydrothermal vent metagenome]|uniref:GGDEF domain-containing protein n=1 Tax=hydrothermal vent metagenome TaxID=652676 RepID=A0A3B0Y8H6_9ZZZZ
MKSELPDPLQDLTTRLASFATQRNWQQFHSPKNLSMALVAEAAELVEIFQWLNEEKSEQLDPEQWQNARMELADIFIYLLRISDRLNVNLVQAAEEKIEINEQRYPIDKVKGSAKRASEYSHNQTEQQTPSLRDPVTGLLEYPVFRLTLEPQLARCRRYNTQLCLARMAVEFIHHPDDINFHAEHLRTITHLLKQNLRWADQVGKTDNGQFLIVLPEASVNDSTLIINKIHPQLNTLSFIKSIAYGVCEWKNGDDDKSLNERTAQAINTAIAQNTLITVL